MHAYVQGQTGTEPHDEESEYKVEACPSGEELKQLVLGRIADSAADALERHLAECRRCSETLHALKLEAEGTPVVNMRTGGGAPRAEKEVVDNLIGQLKQIPVEVPAATSPGGLCVRGIVSLRPHPALKMRTAGLIQLLGSG